MFSLKIRLDIVRRLGYIPPTMTWKQAVKRIEKQKKMPVATYVVGRIEAGATMAEIAREMHVGRTALYYHLPRIGVSLVREARLVVDE